MQTPYSNDNAIFSQKAHEAARSQVYPNAFGVDIRSLDFEDTQFRDGGRSKILDGEMGIDRIIKVTSIANLRHPISFTVQERFRRIKFLDYQDITLTEWNNATNEIGEIYKIAASYMVYGYFDDQKNKIVSPIVVNVTDMLTLICGGDLPFSKSKNPRSNQDFLTLKYSDLYKSGCVMYRGDKPPKYITVHIWLSNNRDVDVAKFESARRVILSQDGADYWRIEYHEPDGASSFYYHHARKTVNYNQSLIRQIDDVLQRIDSTEAGGEWVEPVYIMELPKPIAPPPPVKPSYHVKDNIAANQLNLI